MTGEQPENRLADELSPYLLQHATNPVDWYPWGDEAFDRARAEDKPIFLSIGYSACHWCHVMEHESFRDPAVARLLNEGFVSIKVDREERPDVDELYMTACQLMTGSGGWPLTIVMTPEREPFFAATYLPRESRFGSPGMLDLLPRLSADWRHDRAALTRLADRVRSRLADITAGRPGAEPGQEAIELAVRQLSLSYDRRHGGFGNGVKFPMPHQLLLLLRYWRRTGNEDVLAMVEETLRAMRRGGIYDHVGFGFHRYSTDPEWRVPHFEKMLYDQALHLLAYTEAFQATGKPEYARTAREIVTYVLRDLTSPEGAFYSSEDADSEGVEGRFYLWDEAELRAQLDAETAALVVDTFGISPAGNFESEAGGEQTGSNVLHRRGSLAEVAARAGLEPAEVGQRLAGARQVLYEARSRRVRPGRDDKVLTDWNGLMVGALARAARVLDEPEYAAAARRAARFLVERMGGASGKLVHRYRNGTAGIRGGLDDYACAIFGLLELYETDFDPAHLEDAIRLQSTQEVEFGDPEGAGYFRASSKERRLIVRAKSFEDGAFPAGTSMTLLNLMRLAGFTGDPEFATRAAGLARAYGRLVERAPSAYGLFLAGLDFALGPAFEIVVVGEPGASDTRRLLRIVDGHYLPNKVVMLRPPGETPALAAIAPFVADQHQRDERATAYVCRDHRCSFPTTDPGRLARLLEDPRVAFEAAPDSGPAEVNRETRGRSTEGATP